MADARRFAQSIPCIHCAYDLKGLQLASACPECGKPAHDSLESLWCAEPASVRQLTVWARVAGFGEMVDFIITVAQPAMGFAGVSNSAVGAVSSEVLKRLGQTLSALGYVWIGRRVDTRNGGEVDSQAGRDRFLQIIAATHGILAVLTGLMSLIPVYFLSFTPLMMLGGFVIYLSLAAYGLRSSRAFRRIGWLAQRSNAPRLRRLCSICHWGGLALCVGTLTVSAFFVLGNATDMDPGPLGYLIGGLGILLVVLLPAVLAGCLFSTAANLRRIARQISKYEGPLLEFAESQAPLSDA